MGTLACIKRLILGRKAVIVLNHCGIWLNHCCKECAVVSRLCFAVTKGRNDPNTSVGESVKTVT